MVEFDTYERIAVAEARSSIKIQRSEFIGIAFPVDGEVSFVDVLVRIQKEFHGATHHCWAWRALVTDEVRQHSSDDGEPAGTAGKPILQAIESARLLDTGVVVVRYYGGIKLGTGGLARAYRDAARTVLDGVARESRILYERLTLRVPYRLLSQVYRLVSPPDVVLAGERFGETNEFDIDVRRSRLDAMTKELTEKRIEFVRSR